MRLDRYFGLACWTLALAISVFTAWAYQAGYRINHTASLPIGIYQKKTQSPGSFRHGDLLLVCPPQTVFFKRAFIYRYIGSGHCPGKREELLKPVVALPGETVSVSHEGISVNNHLLPNSKSLTQDSEGRALTPVPYGVYPVKTNDIWLISSVSDRSFDSRYFGPISVRQVVGTAKPIWTP